MPLEELLGIVFDLGGVLTIDPFTGFSELERTWSLPKGWLGARFRGDDEFSKVERGELPVPDFLRGLRARANDQHGATIDLRVLSARLESNRSLRSEAVPLLVQLRERGVRTGLLTNNARESAAWRSEHLGHYLDVMVDSSEVGVRKPDPAVYKHALKLLGTHPTRAAYVDDFEENLVPARAIGLRTVHFTEWNSLLIQLRAWGALPMDSSEQVDDPAGV